MAGDRSILPVRRAQQLIQDYGITEPKEIDLEAIALDRGVFVTYTRIDGSTARLQTRGNHGLIAVDSNIFELGKKRFALAHELGHFEIHRTRTRATICRDKDFLRWHKSTVEETEANAFAAELLMPTEMFQTRCPKRAPSFNIISELAEEFNSSFTATAIRYVEKGPFPSALIVSIKGKTAWFCKSNDFYFKMRNVGSPLDRYSCAGAFFHGEGLPGEPVKVESQSWLDYGPDSRIIIWEHSLYLKNYESMLSLIWAD